MASISVIFIRKASGYFYRRFCENSLRLSQEARPRQRVTPLTYIGRWPRKHSMRALVYTGPRNLELQDLPEPGIGPADVRVKVHAAGVCGSDLHGFLGRSKKRVPPLVLGHEFSGEIVAGGAGVSGFARGDSVAVYPIVGCGTCAFCRVDRENLCSSKQIYGLDFHGGLAEYVAT